MIKFRYCLKFLILRFARIYRGENNVRTAQFNFPSQIKQSREIIYTWETINFRLTLD